MVVTYNFYLINFRVKADSPITLIKHNRYREVLSKQRSSVPGLIRVDGSTAELPNSEEIQKKYGGFKHRQDGRAFCMGRTLMIYDTRYNVRNLAS